MFPPTGKGDVTAKPRVTGTEWRPAMRSLEDMDIETNVTRVKIAPDDTATLDKVSADVCKYTLTLPGVAPPSFSPEIVRVTELPAEIVTPVVVKTTDVDELALDASVRPDMLLSLAPTVGDEVAKKADG